MRLRHPWRLISGAVVLIAIALGAYAGWLVWSTATSLTSAAGDARSLRAAVRSGDDAAIEDAFGRLADRARTARSRTDSVVWSLLTHVPVYGDDARGVRVVSRAADGLARGPLDTLVHRVGDLDALLPAKGGVDLSVVRDLQQPVADGHAALLRAQGELAQEDPSGFTGSLAADYRDLDRQIGAAADTLAAADKALQVLPSMLGGDGERHYLLVMQNNAEIRATGGLPGAVSLVTARDGELTMTKQVAGGSFGEAAEPALPLTQEETALYGAQLGTFFVDANFTPDFPRTAALMKARWEQVEGGTIDGVVSLDPVALSYLLRATGPVRVDGTELTAGNVVDELLHQVYVRIPEPKDQDAYFRQVAMAVFGRLTSGSGDSSALLAALQRGAQEGRILVHDFDAKDQKVFAGTAVAGELTHAQARGPQVGVYLNDATGAKMSYYLRYDAEVRATSCSQGAQALTGRMTVSSTAPADAATTLPPYVTGGGHYGIDPGNQIVNVQVYGPVGGTLDEIRTNGEKDDAQELASIDGRPVRQVWLFLTPGQKAEVTWTMTSAPGQSGPTRLSVTPSIQAGTESAAVRSAC